MESWIEGVVDSKAIEAIFGDVVPCLAGVELLELVVDGRGPTLRLRFNLPDFPESPPKKWVQRQANTVQMTMSAFEVRGLSIQGAASEMIVSLELFREDEGMRVVVNGDHIGIDCLAGWVYVDKISAYTDRRKLPSASDAES